MRRGRPREFWCQVVSEAVVIRLTRRAGWAGRASGDFVQCDQTECQYVEANQPPCPLHLGMFSDEIMAAEADRVARHQDE